MDWNVLIILNKHDDKVVFLTLPLYHEMQVNWRIGLVNAPLLWKFYCFVLAFGVFTYPSRLLSPLLSLNMIYLVHHGSNHLSAFKSAYVIRPRRNFWWNFFVFMFVLSVEPFLILFSKWTSSACDNS